MQRHRDEGRDSVQRRHAIEVADHCDERDRPRGEGEVLGRTATVATRVVEEQQGEAEEHERQCGIGRHAVGVNRTIRGQTVHEQPSIHAEIRAEQHVRELGESDQGDDGGGDTGERPRPRRAAERAALKPQGCPGRAERERCRRVHGHERRDDTFQGLDLPGPAADHQHADRSRRASRDGGQWADACRPKHRCGSGVVGRRCVAHSADDVVTTTNIAIVISGRGAAIDRTILRRRWGFLRSRVEA